MNASGTLLMHT